MFVCTNTTSGPFRKQLDHLLNKIYPHFKFDQKLEIKSPTWQKGVTKTDRSTFSTSCERCICNNVYIARRHDFYRDMTSHRHKIWFWLRIKIVFYFTFYFIRQEIRVIIVHELVHIPTSHFVFNNACIFWYIHFYILNTKPLLHKAHSNLHNYSFRISVRKNGKL